MNVCVWERESAKDIICLQLTLLHLASDGKVTFQTEIMRDIK